MPTETEEGLAHKICKRTDTVIEEKTVPVLTNGYKTACTFGAGIDEVIELASENGAWKTILPIDFGVEGTTMYPLLAADMYEIGYIEVTVIEGVVTIELIVEAEVTMYASAMVLVSDLSEIELFTDMDYEFYEFPMSITLSELPANEMYIMVGCYLDYDEAALEELKYDFESEEHKALVEKLTELWKLMNPVTEEE